MAKSNGLTFVPLDDPRRPSSPLMNGWAVAGLVVGVVAFLSAVVIHFYIGLILGIFGLALSADGIRRSGVLANGRGVAVAGLVLSILALVFGIYRILLLAG